MRTQKEKILIIDNDSTILQVLQTRLSVKGYTVYTSANGENGLQTFRQHEIDLVILDVMLPKIDGYQVCDELKKESEVSIIILTALSNISDRVMGLEFGADDYITKPFSPKELEARIRSVLRRTKNIANKKTIKKPLILEIDSLVIDLYRRKVLRHNKLISLTNIEFNLLELLISRAGEKLSRFFILDSIWGYVPERYIDTRVVDVHISRLRSKLEEDVRKPKLIITARGTGYMFPKI